MNHTWGMAGTPDRGGSHCGTAGAWPALGHARREEAEELERLEGSVKRGQLEKSGIEDGFCTNTSPKNQTIDS